MYRYKVQFVMIHFIPFLKQPIPEKNESLVVLVRAEIWTPIYSLWGGNVTTRLRGSVDKLDKRGIFLAPQQYEQ